MTVPTQASQATFLGNGSDTLFTFSFVSGGDSSYIQVTYIDATGAQTILDASQYTLVLNAAATGQIWGVGGTVTYPTSGSPIANGTQLNVRRIIPLTQTTALSNQGAFYPSVVEKALDLLCLQAQQIANRTGEFRGTWATAIFYNYGDYVIDGANGSNTGNTYMCVIANTSGTWSTDLSNGLWTLATSP